jgi:hypothetical protein
MFRALGGNTTYGLADLSPAGAMSPGCHGRLVTQAVGRASQQVGKSKERERPLPTLRGVFSETDSAALE